MGTLSDSPPQLSIKSDFFRYKNRYEINIKVLKSLFE